MGTKSDKISNKRVNKRIKKLHKERELIDSRLSAMAQNQKAGMPLGLYNQLDRIEEGFYNQLDRIEEEIEVLTRLMEE